MVNLGTLLATSLRKVEEASKIFLLAMKLDPGQVKHVVNYLSTVRNQVLWEEYEDIIEEIYSRCRPPHLVDCAMTAYDAVLLPFPMQWDTAVSTLNSKDMDKLDQLPLSSVHTRLNSEKQLKVGYITFDFRSHPVCYLIRGVFENYDRSHINVSAFSYGPLESSSQSCGSRIRDLSSLFVDMESLDTKKSLSLIYDAGLNILVDLMGHTAFARTDLSSVKPAAVVINYLGFPGSMGMRGYDYIVVDRMVAPVEIASKGWLTESSIYLPHTYQSNYYGLEYPFCGADLICKQEVRRSSDLPLNDFLLCNLGRLDKLEPVVFASWMRILQRVESSKV